MPTIKDVAEVSGYSVCTVSKALSGKGNIREDTRRKILAVVEEIGYHPNRLAVSLKTGRTNSLALIVPDVTNIYFPRLEKYVEQYASQKGYMVFLCDAGNSFEREKNFIEELSRGRVDGVIVTPSTPEHDHIMRLKELGIPYVYLNRYFQDDPDRCIRIDNERGAFECVSYLLDQGYRRIGAVLQSFRNTSYRERYEGMKRAFAQHGMQLDEDLIVFDADDLENSHHAIGALLKKKNSHGSMQHLLGAEGRRKNIRDAVSVGPNRPLEGKSVLLLDDIVTTGATVGECATILRLAGASRVCVAAAAVTRFPGKIAGNTIQEERKRLNF